jgi:hypothetical protein
MTQKGGENNMIDPRLPCSEKTHDRVKKLAKKEKASFRKMTDELIKLALKNR